jgi:putative ABC transport system permease protein
MRNRFLNLFRRSRVSEEIGDELQFHIEECVDELVAQGLSEAGARAQAARRFGSAALCQERTRDVSVCRLAADLLEDAAYALRALGRTPAFTVAAVLTLALGIGATTAIYSVVRTVWLRPLPYRDPDRVVRIWETNARLGIGKFSSSVPNFVSWRERARSFESLVAVMRISANLTGQGDPERLPGLAVTARFFDELGIQPLRGRSFAPEEDAPGHARVAMIGERLWRERFGGDPGLIGRAIQLNSENWTVIGVAPAEMGFASDIDVWQPLTIDPAREEREDHHIVVLGRLKPGVTVAGAEAELNRLAVRLEREFPDSNRDWRALMAPVLDWIVSREMRTALVVLLVAVGLLLAVASINVANLLLARASSRVQEFGIRQALGAGRGRLVRQLIAESLALACAGGTAGAGLAILGVMGLRAILPVSVPRAAQLSLDLTALVVAVALTFATGLVCGLAPAWAATRMDVQSSLRQARGAAAGSGSLRQALVAGEFALATMLVGGAGLLLASFERLQAVSLGLEPRNVLTARISLPQARYSRARTLAFHRDLDRELNAIPGVESAGVVTEVPFGGSGMTMSIGPAEVAANSELKISAEFRMATGGYFRALRIPLRRGRLFDRRDEGDARSLALSESLARRVWPDGRDPIGRQVRLGDNPPLTVVGVVGDVRQMTLADDPAPAMYVSSWNTRNFSVVLRAPGDPARMTAALRRAVARLDPAQPVFAVRPLEELRDADAARPRLNAFLTASFALLALALGVVGVAGVVAYTVVRRTPEMAIRMTLGATPRQVVRAVAASGLWMCLAGLAAGLLGAYALGHAMAQALHQVRPGEPAILGAVAASLLGAALLASWLPARRIARIDPVSALRKE